MTKDVDEAYALLETHASSSIELDAKALQAASDALRLARFDDPKRAAMLLQEMQTSLGLTQVSQIVSLAGAEPGGCEDSGAREIDVSIVYNTLKSVIGYSDLTRKNKALKGPLDKAINQAAKQAFEIMLDEKGSGGGGGGGGVSEILEQLSGLKIQRADLPRNRLGMEHARSVYEAIMGDLDETIEYVNHSEPPAAIDPCVNQPTVSMESALGDDGDSEMPADDADSVPVVILRYSQTKHWFKKALLESEDLRPEREALEHAGYSTKLESGAKIFVRPELFEPIAKYLAHQGYELKSSHVITELAMEEKVREVLNEARACQPKRERGTAKVTERLQAHIANPSFGADHDSAKLDWNSFVKRTFIHVPIPSSLLSTLSACACTA